MADVILGTDLFGDPVTAPKDGRGRPAHVPTLETRNRVLLAFVRGLGHADAAKLVGIDAKTLRKHYSRECELRATAQLRMEQRGLERLNAQAEAGNVAAEKELAKRIEALRMRDASAKFGKLPAAKKASKPKGKKEQRLEAARFASAGDEGWDDLIGGTGDQPH